MSSDKTRKVKDINEKKVNGLDLSTFIHNENNNSFPVVACLLPGDLDDL